MKTLLLTWMMAAAGAPGGTRGHVAGSKHDLSAAGPGELRASTEQSPCAFCHVSHGSGDRLNARPEPVPMHRGYESATVSKVASSTAGASRICLSCHDGTVAVGRTRTREIPMAGGDRPVAPGRRANLGTDLRGSHPISVNSTPGVTADPPAGDPVQLDRAGRVQCTSCHDPHEEFGDPTVGKFLVKDTAFSALCRTCHVAVGGARQSSHLVAAVQVDSADGTRSGTMAEIGCAACHLVHRAEPGTQLVAMGATDDARCLECHDGRRTRVSIAVEVAKPSAHRALDRGRHDPAERAGEAAARRGTMTRASRHVACVDCHDPHQADATAAVAPAANGFLAGQWGIGLDGQRVETAQFEYEVCLKCHGDSAPNTPALSSGGAVRRAAADGNLRLVFQASSPSFHPVAAPGRNPNVPSLIAPLDERSLIYCTDCHASDDGPAAGGAGARGPHGSRFPWLLERQYLVADGTVEGPDAYALCYKCHDRQRLLSATSPFPHDRHVVTSSTPCSACHAAHGVSAVAGNDLENANLVSFDLNIVRATAGGAPRYTSGGPGLASCNLTCHGRLHDSSNSRY